MAKESTFYLGRVLKFGALNDVEIVRALEDPRVIRRGRFLYTVTSYGSHRSERGAEYHSGRLAKFRPTGEVGVVEPDLHVELTEDIPNLLEATSTFVFLPEFSAVAYQHVWNQIERDRFGSLWGELIVERFEGLFRRCEVEPITDLRAFVRRVAALQRISKLDAIVHPPNPLFGPAWASLSNYMRRRNLDSATIREVAKGDKGIESGLIEVARAASESQEGEGIGERDLLASVGESVGDAAMLMAVDGYGKGKIEGTKGEERRVIRTYEAQQGFKAPSDAEPAILYDMTYKILVAINDDRYLAH